MKYRYYPSLIKYIVGGVNEKYPEVVAKEDLKDIPAHILWMMDKMQEFDDKEKAARWIGWIMAHAEILGILDNEKSRELVRVDLKNNLK